MKLVLKMLSSISVRVVNMFGQVNIAIERLAKKTRKRSVEKQKQ